MIHEKAIHQYTHTQYTIHTYTPKTYTIHNTHIYTNRDFATFSRGKIQRIFKRFLVQNYLLVSDIFSKFMLRDDTFTSVIFNAKITYINKMALKSLFC